MQKYYKFKYRFNASHSRDGISENEHSHTFTITLYISEINQSEQIMFFDIDNAVNKYLEKYQLTYLNEMKAFQGKIPDIEVIGDVFFEDIKNILVSMNVVVHQLDICENPLNVYQVSDRIHLPSCYINLSKDE